MKLAGQLRAQQLCVSLLYTLHTDIVIKSPSIVVNLSYYDSWRCF